MNASDLIKFIPAAVLLITFIATTAVSQYQIGQLVENDKNEQETLSSLAIGQAELKIRVEHLEKP